MPLKLLTAFMTMIPVLRARETLELVDALTAADSWLKVEPRKRILDRLQAAAYTTAEAEADVDEHGRKILRTSRDLRNWFFSEGDLMVPA